MTEKLSEVEARLGDRRFLRCHQSYLVNMDHVYKADKDFLMENGAVVPIRVRSRKALTEAYYRYFVEHATANRGRRAEDHVPAR